MDLIRLPLVNPWYFEGDTEDRSRVEEITETMQTEIIRLASISEVQMNEEFGHTRNIQVSRIDLH